jgi:hypothetical protein
MRYLRQQQLNRRAIFDSRMYVDMTDSIVMNTTNNMLMPSGTTAQRPVSPVVGMMRYNTDSNEVEIYEGSSATWRNVRYKESGQITQQTLGNLDGYTAYYGPLNPAPPASNKIANGATWSGSNIFVYIENVPQLYTSNYTLTQNPVATVATTTTVSSGTTLTFGISGSQATKVIPQGSIVTGSASLQANTVVTVNSDYTVTLSKSITGTISSGTTLTFTAASGWYITFNVDSIEYIGLVGKPVTALIGFDQ